MAAKDNKAINLSGTGDADSIALGAVNSARNVTIKAGDGNDTVINYGSNVSISGGAGADSIKSTSGSKVTINGGSGNDTLIGSDAAEVFQFGSGDDNNIIVNFGTNDTLHIASGSISTHYNSAADYVLEVRGGGYPSKITLKGAADLPINVRYSNGKSTILNSIVKNYLSNVTVKGTTSADSIENGCMYVTINAGAGDDTIRNISGNNTSINAGAGNDSVYSYEPKDVTIVGGTGNDTIYNRNGSNVTINAGDGNDIIRNESSSSSVNGGAGNDKITISSYSTVRGGGGNDTISGGGHNVYQFSASDGNNVVNSFTPTDTLQVIAASTLSNYYASGSDLIVEVKGKNSVSKVTLKNNAINHVVAVLDAKGNLTGNTSRSTVMTATI